MNLELVTIGDELLLGFTIDTNAAHLARELASIGVKISRRATVGDEPSVIATAVREALERTGAVITTGGLGPTADDRTKPVIASIFGREMMVDHDILSALEARWMKRFGHPLPVSNRQQAQVPVGATILNNRHGSAPGIWLEDNRGWVAMLPGVPREMRGMLADTLMPLVRDRLGAAGGFTTVVRSRTLRTANIAESALADRLGELAGGVNGLPLAYLPGNDGVDLRLTADGLPPRESDAALEAAGARLYEKIGQFVYGEGADDMAAIVLAECGVRGETISVAESCTGGLLGARLTAIPGSSAVFHGGIIAYDNSVKVRDLGVSEAELAEHGAVSESIARTMASAVRAHFNTSIGIGITGIAGPDGGTPEKPVGTVWIATDIDGEVNAIRGVLAGDRNEIRFRASQVALDRIRRAYLKQTDAEAWTARA